MKNKKIGNILVNCSMNFKSIDLNFISQLHVDLKMKKTCILENICKLNFMC